MSRTTDTLDVNLASSNWVENRPFSFDSHVETIECTKVVIQPAYIAELLIPCPKKCNFKNIGLF